MHDLGRVDAVFTVGELNDAVHRVPDRQHVVVVHLQVVHRVDQSTLHVPGLRCTNRGVDQGLTAAQGELEELCGLEATLERRRDETPLTATLVAALEVREDTVLVTTDLCLADGTGHHCQGLI